MVDLLTILFAFIILGCFNLSLTNFGLFKKKKNRERVKGRVRKQESDFYINFISK